VQLPRKAQNRILVTFSTSSLSRVQSEPQRGPQLYVFLNAIGTYMRALFYDQPLTTDQVTSVLVERNVTEEQWSLVRRSVGLGLLYPNVSANNPDQLPEREGVFHLAYVLAPHFKLLPRRGKARKLTAILEAAFASAWGRQQLSQGILNFDGLVEDSDGL
jgi:hypothetical protein